MPDIRNASDVNTARRDEDITDVTGKSEFIESEEKVSVDKAGWIVRRISELGGYENISDSVKADIFGFDIADVSGSIRLFSDVMKRLEIKQKIRCGIGAEEGDSSAGLFYNLKRMFEKSNKVFYNKIEIIYNKIVKLYF